MSGNLIFALDIGTRSVVGVVMQETAKGLEIVASEHLEHQNRAMIDGQIHDIEEVSKAIKTVKEKLETKIGQTLSQVAVAAAGRALRTVRLKVNTDISDYKEIHRDDILRLELQAVQEAQNKLAEGVQNEAERLLNYHCVGYSVVHYELDGFKIGNLYSQKGKNIGVEVIATFLPKLVVDSLFAALSGVDLEMTSLTLEPIAASAVVVPPSMRQLNIALVDVGAGTSDIAITDDGSIGGYGMVPIAGDEVTERISQHYLVDFNQAETIKRAIHDKDEVSFCDVLGIEHKVSKQEVIDVITEAVQNLTRQVSEKIIEINGKTPQAVICIGGGSLTPLFKEMLADNLGLTKQRVAIRGREAITEVFGAQELVGPEAVTPIGIAVTSFEHKGLGFARVMVNNTPVRLFEVNRGTVADALLAAGISMRRTQPRLGMALTVTVNGELKIIKGGRGKPAVIKLNGHQVTIDAPVKHNDVIEFIEAFNGQDATGYIYDVVPNLIPINISVNEEPFTINPVITMNGSPVTYSDELSDNARLVFYLPRTVAEVVEIAGYNEQEAEYRVSINGIIVDPMVEINDGDDITVKKSEEIFEVFTQDDGDNDFEIDDIENVNGNGNGNGIKELGTMDESQSLSGDNGSDDDYDGEGNPADYVQSELEIAAANSGSEKSVVTVVYVNQEKVEIPRADIILTDILTRVNFPLRPPLAGMRLEMKVNGFPAEFTTSLKYGDSISLNWVT